MTNKDNRNYYYARISCPNEDDQNHFGSIIKRLKEQTVFKEELKKIPWKLREAKKGDILFLYIGGDAGKKSKYFKNDEELKNYANGVYGIGLIESTDVGQQKVLAEFYGFTFPVTKTQLYFYPQFIDNLGGSTKGSPDQAGLHQLTEDQAKSLIDFLKLNSNLGVSEQILSDINSEGYLIRTGKDAYQKQAEYLSNGTNLIFTALSESSNKDLLEQDIAIGEDFDIDKFINALRDAGIIVDKSLVVRIVSSLCTKPFLILTGLSGSGKTQLAVNFARWICGTKNIYYQILEEALVSADISSKYEVVSKSEQIVELINNQGSSGKIIPLPTNVIFEWYEALMDGLIKEEDDPKEVAGKLKDKSRYQKYIHGFYGDFHSVAVEMNHIKNSKNISEIRQYEIIAVGADWTNRDPLLGYPNALQQNKYVKPDNGSLDLLIRANKNPSLPFFLILDEMNLSHVERYFADFLSAMETNEEIPLYSNKKMIDAVPSSISLPPNLFIIGTVNIDETTYMFSPKVLDRANTVEFRVSKDDIKEYFDDVPELNIASLESRGVPMSASFLNIARNKNFQQDVSENISNTIIDFFVQLKKIGSEFGFRSVGQINRLVQQLSEIDKNLEENEKIDVAIIQKLLPKLHGSRRKISPVLITLGKLCVVNEIEDIEKVFLDENFKFYDNENVKYPLSLEKISRMYKNALDNGFTSFAET